MERLTWTPMTMRRLTSTCENYRGINLDSDHFGKIDLVIENYRQTDLNSDNYGEIDLLI